MTRRTAVWTCVTLALAGCGKVSPTGFSDKNRETAIGLLNAVRKKATADLPRIAQRVESLYANKNMNAQEYKVFQAALDLAKQDKWDDAEKLLDDSIKIKN